MHVSDPTVAVAAMTRLLHPHGALLLEMSDIASLRFVPYTDPAANLWQRWWFALGKALGASYDIFDQTPDLLRQAGLVIERRDRFQPVPALPQAKMLTALGFAKCVPG